MSEKTGYTKYHPKWFRPRMSVWWWLKRWPFTRFVIRELTSVFVAYFALITLWQLKALGDGPDGYSSFVARMKTAPFIVMNGIAFLFVLFHAVTWFNLAPKAMVIQFRGKRVPDVLIGAANYIAWVLASLAVAYFLMGGG